MSGSDTETRNRGYVQGLEIQLRDAKEEVRRLRDLTNRVDQDDLALDLISKLERERDELRHDVARAAEELTLSSTVIEDCRIQLEAQMRQIGNLTRYIGGLKFALGQYANSRNWEGRTWRWPDPAHPAVIAQKALDTRPCTVGTCQ